MEKGKSTLENLEINSFYKNKRILLTGHSGFKGSWLHLILQRMGAKVYGISLPPESEGTLFHYSSKASSIQGTFEDIRNAAVVKKIVHEFQPEIVFHLAAQPLVRRSYKNPIENYEINIMGSLYILESLRECPSLLSAVIITTDKCYENLEWPWPYRENDHLGGHDPYAASKACVEILTQSYYKSFFKQKGKGLASARAGNVIGGGDWSEDRLIPDIFRSIQNNKTLEIRNPRATRPWQHVLEPLTGYLLLGMKSSQNPEVFSQAYNFGPESSSCLDVESLILSLQKTMTSQINYKIVPTTDLHEARLLMLDSSKSRINLGWKSKFDIHQALQKTTEWYEAFLRNKNCYELSLMQIENYFQL